MSTVTADRLTQLMQQELAPSVLQLTNESYMHKVPKDAETHFKAVVVSERFTGLAPVQRHRLVYAAVKPELQANGGTVHALAITAKTAAEWEALQGCQDALQAATQRSPPCLGGGTHR